MEIEVMHKWVVSDRDAEIDSCDECGAERSCPIPWLPDLYVYRSFGHRYWYYDDVDCVIPSRENLC